MPERNGVMPKETIVRPHVEHGPLGEDGWPVTKSTTGPEIEVCWGHGDTSEVRLHTASYDPHNGFDHHFSLSRVQVNAMIRTLRKARDQAFGRDE